MRISLFVLLSLFALDSFCQITIPTTHLPRIGDEFTFNVHSQIYTPKPLAGGVYDFSDLVQNDTTVIKYIANDNTIEYPTANLKMIEVDNDQATIYLKTSASDLFLIGLNASQTQIPLPNISKLTGTLKYLSLPITASTNITTNDQISATIPKSFFPPEFNIDSLAGTLMTGLKLDSFKVRLNFSLNLYADGQGKIKTPIDSNLDVIKLVRKITVNPKISVFGSLGGVVPINDIDITTLISGQLPVAIPNIITHSYISPSYRQEIVTASLDSNGNYNSVNYRKSTKNGTAPSAITVSQRDNISIGLSDKTISILQLPQGKRFSAVLYQLDGRQILQSVVSSKQNELALPYSLKGFIINIWGDNLFYSQKICTTP